MNMTIFALFTATAFSALPMVISFITLLALGYENGTLYSSLGPIVFVPAIIGLLFGGIVGYNTKDSVFNPTIL